MIPDKLFYSWAASSTRRKEALTRYVSLLAESWQNTHWESRNIRTTCSSRKAHLEMESKSNPCSLIHFTSLNTLDSRAETQITLRGEQIIMTLILLVVLTLWTQWIYSYAYMCSANLSPSLPGMFRKMWGGASETLKANKIMEAPCQFNISGCPLKPSNYRFPCLFSTLSLTKTNCKHDVFCIRVVFQALCT